MLTLAQNTHVIVFQSKKKTQSRYKDRRSSHEIVGTLPLLCAMNSPTETNISSAATQCGVSSTVAAQTEQSYSKDFIFLPIPRRLRYDPAKPFHFGMLLNVSFGIGSTFGEPLNARNMIGAYVNSTQLLPTCIILSQF